MTDTKKERPYQISRDRFHEQQHRQQTYFVQVPSGIKPEQLEDPAFFSTVASLCRPSGLMFVESDDGLWLAQTYIISCGANFVNVRVLQVWDMSEYKGPAAQADPSGYKVEWGGRYHGWRVVRESDKAVVFKEGKAKQEADVWLTEHLKAVAR